MRRSVYNISLQKQAFFNIRNNIKYIYNYTYTFFVFESYAISRMGNLLVCINDFILNKLKMPEMIQKTGFLNLMTNENEQLIYQKEISDS